MSVPVLHSQIGICVANLSWSRSRSCASVFLEWSSSPGWKPRCGEVWGPFWNDVGWELVGSSNVGPVPRKFWDVELLGNVYQLCWDSAAFLTRQQGRDHEKACYEPRFRSGVRRCQWGLTHPGRCCSWSRLKDLIGQRLGMTRTCWGLIWRYRGAKKAMFVCSRSQPRLA